MKAVVLHEYGGPEKLKFEDNVPDPQVSGDTVLIAAAAASVNPIDWKVRSGRETEGFSVVVSGNSWPRCEWRRTRRGRECEDTSSPVTAYLRSRMRPMPNWWQCPIRT